MNTNRVAEIGAMIGDPARVSMLAALMDGRALTAGELASVAGITPSTASGHLGRLTETGLLAVEKQGRHRYFRLPDAEVAGMLEGMMRLATRELAPAKVVRTGPKDAAMRRARTCYDHFAGRLGVAIADVLVDRGYVIFDGDSGTVTEAGISGLSEMGITGTDDFSRGASRRPVCRPCLDWSERVPHLAGRLGAEICRHFMDQGYVRRIGATRALDITPPGQQALRRLFEIRNL